MMQTFYHLIVRVGHGEVLVAKYTNKPYADYVARELRRRHGGVAVRTHKARVLHGAIPQGELALHLRQRAG